MFHNNDIYANAHFEVVDAVITTATIIANVEQGGDAGHGGFVEIRISGQHFSVNGGDSDDTLCIRTKGDAECRNLASLLCELGAWLMEEILRQKGL